MMRARGTPVVASMTAMAVLLLAAAQPTFAETLTFTGRVEAYQRAELSSRLDGIVAEVLFTGGERVTAGSPLIVLDDADFELALASAEAAVRRAQAEVTHARQALERVRALDGRGIATQVQGEAAELSLRVAEAELAAARAAAERARLDFERSVIRAPIDGLVSRPRTAVGAFLEAEAGPPLGEIVHIDPAVIAYRVPYATRLDTMERTGTKSIEALFERIELELKLPGGRIYPLRTSPDFASATVDPEDGTLTVWATVPNPDYVLRPGMEVTVLSRIMAPGGSTE